MHLSTSLNISLYFYYVLPSRIYQICGNGSIIICGGEGALLFVLLVDLFFSSCFFDEYSYNMLINRLDYSYADAW